MNNKKEIDDKYQGIPIQIIPSVGGPTDYKTGKFRVTYGMVCARSYGKKKKLLKVIAALKESTHE